MKGMFTSIRAKVLAILLAIALMGTGIGVFAVVRMGTLHTAAEHVSQRALVPTTQAIEVQSNVQSIAALGGGELSNPKAVNVFEPVRQSHFAAVNAMLAGLRHDQLTPVQRVLLGKLEVAWANLDPRIDTVALWFANQGPKVLPYFNAVNATSANLVDNLQNQDTLIEASANSAYTSAVTVTWTVIAVVFVVALLLGLVLSGALVRPLRRTVRVLEEVAGGDLTQSVEVKTSDEVGQMARSLNVTISTVHDVVQQLELDAERLTAYAENAIDQSTSPEAKAQATSLAGMAEGLQAMISIFKLRQGPRPAETAGQAPEAKIPEKVSPAL